MTTYDVARLPDVPALLSVADLMAHLGEHTVPTEEQAGAITAALAPALVVAGAGSGKTQTMGLRVMWLVANGLVEPHRVLGLTFTRKAAAELGARVRLLLRRLRAAHERAPFLTDEVAAGLTVGEPTVSTYHSYAAALVGEHALRLGVEPTVRLIGEALSWQYVTQVVDTYDGDMSAVTRARASVIGDVLALAADLQEHLRSTDDLRGHLDALEAMLGSLPRGEGQRAVGLPAPVRELLVTIRGQRSLLPMVEGYVRRKTDRAAMDYADQVALAARLARGHPEVAAVERARYGVVLLDEYQDTGEAQRVLLQALFAGGAVTAVGDPRQSIYGWRGASAGNLERFLTDFTTPEAPAGSAHELTTSFRNRRAVLRVANRLARDIPLSAGRARDLVAAHGLHGAGDVRTALFETVEDEAAWIADSIASLAGDRGVPWGEMVVLARKRSHFARLEDALRVRDVPCEVVGLGGLLLEPEIVDVVATLTVLADPTAGAALLRLISGARWRLGPRDIAALGRRARALAARDRPPAGDNDSDTGGDKETVVEADALDEGSLLDALDDLGASGQYSTEGVRRLSALRDELRGLRGWLGQPLPDIVAAVAHTLCLDLELGVRSGLADDDATRTIDRLVETAEDFAASGEDPGLRAFLAYLATAEERERGLELDRALGGQTDSGVVQLMTVHAAKGLEWDAVFVAGLSAKVFPVEGQAVPDWTKQIATLPFPLRGDRAELPVLDLALATDQGHARDAVEQFRTECKTRSLVEEQRLAYVAVTRARHLLACTGYWWDSASRRRGPSSLLCAVREVCSDGVGEVVAWVEDPGDEAINPMLAVPARRSWPYDVAPDQRAALKAGRERVIDAHGRPLADESLRAEVMTLLAEHARRRQSALPEVELPARLSVSQLVELRRDPAAMARSLRRPVPRRPSPRARRGTEFHRWLAERWGQQRLLDIDELPGAADETAPADDRLQELQDAFVRSDWWDREPIDVEWPFDLVVDGVLLRGRCDAVFGPRMADPDGPFGQVEVIDWKTGARPADDEAASVQLAVYRLAWHELSGTPLERISAAFHYVATGTTVRPADLLDRGGLVALLRDLPPPS